MPASSPGDRDLVGAVDDAVVLERDLVDGRRKAQCRNAPEQRLEHDLQFLASQVLAKALVRTVAEGDVVPGAALDVELACVGERAAVPVGGHGRRDDTLARLD